MNKAETRAAHIDPAIQAAGWGVVDGSQLVTICHQLKLVADRSLKKP